jgi:hypothetical protein
MRIERSIGVSSAADAGAYMRRAPPPRRARGAPPSRRYSSHRSGPPVAGGLDARYAVRGAQLVPDGHSPRAARVGSIHPRRRSVACGGENVRRSSDLLQVSCVFQRCGRREVSHVVSSGMLQSTPWRK